MAEELLRGVGRLRWGVCFGAIREQRECAGIPEGIGQLSDQGKARLGKLTVLEQGEVAGRDAAPFGELLYRETAILALPTHGGAELGKVHSKV